MAANKTKAVFAGILSGPVAETDRRALYWKESTLLERTQPGLQKRNEHEQKK